LFAGFSLHSHAQVTATFKVDISNYLSSGGSINTSVGIAGNFTTSGCTELPNWLPEAGKMIYWKDSIWVRTLNFTGTANDSLQWKYVRGNSWSSGDEGSSWPWPEPTCMRPAENNNRKVFIPESGNIVIGSNWATCHSITPTSPRPIISILPGPTSICAGDSIPIRVQGAPGAEYRWTIDGTTTFLTTDSIIYAKTAGTYSVVAFNSHGAHSLSQSVILTLLPAPISEIIFTDSTTFCNGDSILLQTISGPGQQYQWTKDGSILDGDTDTSLWVYESGSYQMTKTSGSCSATSAAVSVTVKPTPEAIISVQGSASFCLGDSAILRAGSGTYGYTWFRNGQSVPGGNVDSIVVMQSGSYTVELDLDGCKAVSEPFFIVANPIPQPVIDSSGVTLSTSTSYVFYQWYLNDTLLSGADSSVLQPVISGVYTVSVTDQNGCRGISPPKAMVVLSTEPLLESAWQLGPNPFTDKIYVFNSANGECGLPYRLSDVSGKVCETGYMTCNQPLLVDATLPRGLYLLTINDFANRSVRHFKMVKE